MSVRPAWAAVAATVCSLLAHGCGPPAASPPYNVLFISLDTVRQDALGCYGRRPRHAPRVSTSPHLDRLASEGVRMIDAYATSPWTLPSHMSMMTGQPALVHGVETYLQTLDPSRPVLAEILRERGYRTAGVFSGPYVEPHWGFGRGFERYRACYGPETAEASRQASGLRGQLIALEKGGDRAELAAAMERQQETFHRLEHLSERDVSSDQVTAGTLEELEKLGRGSEPWLIFAHYFDPHSDYVPPPPYDTRFDPDYGGTIDGVGFLDNPRIAVPDPARPDTWTRRATERDLEHVLALYEGEIAWVDAHLGRVLDRLDTLGLSAKTLVVVVSDHGEEFFEHGGIGHHRTVYEEAVKVPLLLRLPGVLPAGQAVRGAVSVADLMPTVLEVLGVPVPRGLGSTSFLRLARDGAAGAAPATLSRLVNMRIGSATLDAQTTVAVREVSVQEAFWQGRIKVLRRRAWPQFAEARPEVKAILERETETRFGQEELTWIDVERFPAERDAEHVRTFTDPAARAALAAFRTHYTELLRLRTSAPAAEPPENVRHALQGLGYIDPSSPPAALWAWSPEVVLPPPGAGVDDSR